jgi:hypothetical protein
MELVIESDEFPSMVCPPWGATNIVWAGDPVFFTSIQNPALATASGMVTVNPAEVLLAFKR